MTQQKDRLKQPPFAILRGGYKYKETGLYTLFNSETFKNSEFTATIHLQKQYRGRIPDLIYNIDKELNKDKK